MEKDKQECPFCCEEIDINATKCPECGEALLKPCPYCGETIKAVAIKCKHCGAMLDDSVEVQIINHNIPNFKTVKKEKEEYLCNFCKQTVDADAKKCPHCGEWLEDKSQTIPFGIQYFNWGIVFLSFIWAICNRCFTKVLTSWIVVLLLDVLLVILLDNSNASNLASLIISIAYFIFLGTKGNEWAWQNGNWRDTNEFNSIQEKWAIGGFCSFIFSIFGIVCWVVSMCME